MDEEKDLKSTEDKIEDVTPEPPKDVATQESSASAQQEIQNILDFFSFLEYFRTAKRHLTTVPDFVPRTFWEQIQFLDDGVNRRIYVWVNGTWRYTALT